MDGGDWKSLPEGFFRADPLIPRGLNQVRGAYASGRSQRHRACGEYFGV